MRRWMRALAIVASLGLLAAACGGDEGGGGGGGGGEGVPEGDFDGVTITFSTSLVAVWCSRASRNSALRSWISLNSRTFSMAITA